jgi:hypothetical protein
MSSATATVHTTEPAVIDATEISAATAIYSAAPTPTEAAGLAVTTKAIAEHGRKFGTRPLSVRELAIIAAVESGKPARIKQANGTYIFLDGKTPSQRKQERRKERRK